MAPSAGEEAGALRVLRNRLERLLPVMGITRVGHIGGLDVLGLPVAQAVRPLSCSLSVAQGKGATRIAAEISAVLEAAETWHAERAFPMAIGPYSDLSRRIACPTLEGLPVYAGREADPEAPYRWILARDIGSGGTVMVPYDLVHTRFTLAHNDEVSPFYRSTSGLAAGVMRECVLVHAICEVIERDAAARFGRAAAGAVPVPTEKVWDAASCALLARAAEAGLGCAVWTLPHPSKVPVSYVVLSGDGGRLQGSQARFGGYGCALCPQEATQRAMFEAAQSRLTVIAGARDDLEAKDYAWEPLRVSSRGGEGQAAGLTPLDLPMAARLPELLRRLAGAGYSQVLAVDLGRAETGLEVVRVVIPGMDVSVTPGDCAPVTRPQL